MTGTRGAPLPRERSGREPDADLLARRDRFVASPYNGPIPVHDVVLGGVPARVLMGGDDIVVVYLHGGGYRMGTAAAYTTHGAALAAASGARVVLVEYRLAPEAPFPAGLHDAVAVYRAVRQENPHRPVVVAGDSAGGGLAAAVVLVARATSDPAPDGIALLSPWLDLRCDSSFYATSPDPLFDQATALTARDSYLQGHDPDDPYVSPVRADLHSFPPALVQVGTSETLLGDALKFATGLATVGVDCRLEVVAGRGHTWPLTAPGEPESVAAVESTGRFLRSRATDKRSAARRAGSGHQGGPDA